MAKVPYGRKVEGGATFHDIRRTVKTNMFYAGVDKVYRDLILGHSLKGMDVHYLSPSEEALRKAMDKYADWIDEKVKRRKKLTWYKGELMQDALDKDWWIRNVIRTCASNRL